MSFVWVYVFGSLRAITFCLLVCGFVVFAVFLLTCLDFC